MRMRSELSCNLLFTFDFDLPSGLAFWSKTFRVQYAWPDQGDLWSNPIPFWETQCQVWPEDSRGYLHFCLALLRGWQRAEDGPHPWPWAFHRELNFNSFHNVCTNFVLLTQGDLEVTEISHEERQHFPPISCVHNRAEPSRDIVKKNSSNFNTYIEIQMIIGTHKDTRH